MPYIKQDSREKFQGGSLFGEFALDAGELNYVITVILKAYMNNHGKSYKVMNEIVGVLECAKMEFYRRMAAPYEDNKIVENGDVY